jgi:hypothetical protein
VSQYPTDPSRPPLVPGAGQWGSAPPPQQVASGQGWGQPSPGLGWGAGGPTSLGPASKKTNPAAVIVIVVVLIAVGIGAYVQLSGGDDAGDSPEATVEALFNAAKAHDCGAEAELMSSQTFEAMGGRDGVIQACEEALAEEEDLSVPTEDAELVSVEVTSRDDATATVRSAVRLPTGETIERTYDLVEEGGQWKINLAVVDG